METVLIGCISLVTGFTSGLLGIGGGIIMAPLLLFVPPLFGLAAFSMKTITGLTLFQALVACIIGTLTHRRFNYVSRDLVVYMGSSIFIASLAGGAATKFVSNNLLLVLFAFLAGAAAILILKKNLSDPEKPDESILQFSKFRAVSAAVSVGFIGGLVGQGGSFILIPLMTAYVRIPTRIAIGSNLAIVTLASFAGFSGKALVGEINWPLTLPILVAVPIAAYWGSILSHKCSVALLRRLLAVIIVLAVVKILTMIF
jgi:uncharacterized membrane protein YfcA